MPVKLLHVLLILGCVVFLSACLTTPDYHLIYPKSAPPDVTSWEYDVVDNDLTIHFSWAKPAGDGPFPTVMVHPHGGKTTTEMQGVLWDLASRGYLAVAVDYKRLINGKYQRNTFVWSNARQSTRALYFIRESKWADPDRIAALGFSQGAMLSLIIAANAPDQVKTVIAYYPVADFESWFKKDRDIIGNMVFHSMRKHFYEESGAKSEQEFLSLLKKASPMNYLKDIKVPVLLIHGDHDSAAPYQESEKLFVKLESLKKEAELVIVPDGVHIFNFRQPEQAIFAWEKTLAWLAQYLEVKEKAE